MLITDKILEGIIDHNCYICQDDVPSVHCSTDSVKDALIEVQGLIEGYYDPLLKSCLEVLRTVQKDAEMALCDEWDRTDEGFNAQLDAVTNLINDIEKE